MRPEKRIPVQKIYLDQEAANSELSRHIRSQRPDLPIETVKSSDEFQSKIRDLPLSAGKKILWITNFKGPFLKPCPATQKPYLCCRYWVINAQTHCPLDCSYCILQGYLNQPVLTLYANTEEIFSQADALLANSPGRLLRMGTGELSDSFALDHLTHQNESLIAYACSRPLILELKTKTDWVESLPIAAKKNVVISWSLNPDEIVRKEERRTAPFEKRLAAASRAIEKGYLVGFHFDPLLEYPGWEALYETVIGQLTGRIPEDSVAWLSLGTLRFPPALKSVIEKRFPHSEITSAEWVRGLDGKLRYFRPVRTAIYRKVHGWIRKKWPNAFLYFCMENKTVWRSVFGFAPEDNAHLDYLFHESLWRRFPALNLAAPKREAYVNDENVPAPGIRTWE